VDTEVPKMNVKLAASTGAMVDVWREKELFCARRTDRTTEPEICLGVDLFEVIAELVGLDLDDARQAAEAVSLAEQAQSCLGPDARTTGRT
jgi:hypothetical protein